MTEYRCLACGYISAKNPVTEISIEINCKYCNKFFLQWIHYLSMSEIIVKMM